MANKITVFDQLKTSMARAAAWANNQVAQVAQAVGYDDPLYFSALFRRKMGMAPSRYREEFGGG